MKAVSYFVSVEGDISRVIKETNPSSWLRETFLLHPPDNGNAHGPRPASTRQSIIDRDPGRRRRLGRRVSFLSVAGSHFRMSRPRAGLVRAGRVSRGGPVLSAFRFRA